MTPTETVLTTCEICNDDMGAESRCLDPSRFSFHHCEDCQTACHECHNSMRDDLLIEAADARREDGYR